MASVKSRLATFLYYAFRVCPVKRNKIFVKNFYGKGFGDSPKYIIKQLLHSHPEYDIVWCVNNNEKFPKGIRAVNLSGYKGLLQSIYEQTTAKVWIDNSRKHTFERKRKGQYYIQTWHGDIGVKKISGDLVDKMPKAEIEQGKHDSKMIDLFVSGNEWFSNRCNKRFFYSGEIVTCGLPRRDIFYRKDTFKIEEIRKRLGIPDGGKLLLYVPTFRKEDIINHQLGSYASDFDWNLILKSLNHRFAGEWYGLMRLHPVAAKYSKDLQLSQNVINVTDFSDISELMLVSDVCISDYSSALFDFAVTKKPGFIFAPDSDKYSDERGYLFTDNELPFTVSKNIQELAQEINNFDQENYLKKHNMFYNQIIHVNENGHASEYLVKRIEEICNSSQ